jgi:PAS domain S-box-containing protein
MTEPAFDDILDPQEIQQRKLAQLAAIVESSDDAIISKNLQGTIMSWNQAAERIFGYTAKEMVGASILRLIPPGREGEEHEILSKIQRAERIDHYETVRRRKDGRLIDVSVTVSPIKDSEGRVVGASKIAHDITEDRRIAAELAQRAAALNESEQRYRFLADTVPQIVWTAKPDGKLDYFNQRWFDYSGLTLEETKDWGWKASLHADDQERCIETWTRALATGDDYELEFRIMRADKVYRWHLVRAFPMRNEAGEIVQWVGSCTDIDDQRRANEVLEKTVVERTAKLRASVEELEAYSYSISHDMRAPLRAMSGFSNILKEEYGAKLDEEANGFLDRIINASARMDALIKDVLSYSRISRGEFILGPIDAERLIRDIVGTYTHLGPAEIDVSISGKLPLVCANEAAFTQCVSNLLGNAVKFVQPGKKPCVQVRGEKTGDNVRLWF